MESELSRVVDALPGLVWTALPDGQVDFLNRRWSEYTGLEIDRSCGRGWQAAAHPEDLPELLAALTSVDGCRAPLEREARLRGADGRYRWFLFRAHPSIDPSGKVVKWCGLGIDVDRQRQGEEILRIAIEDSKRAEEKAVEAERELQRTIDNIPLLVGTYRGDGTRLFVNKRALEITGLSEADMADERWMEKAYHPDDVEAIERQWRTCLATGEPFERETRTRVADGTYRWHVTRRMPLRDERGIIIRWYGFSYDIEDQKRAEDELRRSEAYLAEAQRLAHIGSWAIDFANRRATHSSEEQHRLFGFDPAAGFPSWREWRERVHPEDRETNSEIVRRSAREKTDFEMDYRVCHPDGTIRYMHVVGHPVLDAAGEVAEFVGTSIDVTQRRLAEDALDKARSELAHVSRSMSLGALTASIAHEVNQPLAGIITNANTCLRMLAAAPPNVDGARETARRTIRDGNRAADVIARLRALFSRKELTTEVVDLNEVAREVLSLVFGDLLRNKVTLRTEIDDERPLLVTGDRVQLQQVILNLVRNASDAMSDVNDRPRHLLVRAEDEDGQARLIVKDAGVGFEAQGAERLFDAFYTTKSNGMGIGLSVSRSIIESHGGKLWADANEGPGATFSFSIPRLVEAATGEALVTSAGKSETRAATT